MTRPGSRGPKDNRPPGGPRPLPQVQFLVRIKDQLVQCRRCYHVAGPYPDRASTVAAAERHYLLCHDPRVLPETDRTKPVAHPLDS